MEVSKMVSYTVLHTKLWRVEREIILIHVQVINIVMKYTAALLDLEGQIIYTCLPQQLTNMMATIL